MVRRHPFSQVMTPFISFADPGLMATATHTRMIARILLRVGM
jgi:hypothetical protein